MKINTYVSDSILYTFIINIRLGIDAANGYEFDRNNDYEMFKYFKSDQNNYYCGFTVR